MSGFSPFAASHTLRGIFGGWVSANFLDGLVAGVVLQKPNSQGLALQMGGSVFYFMQSY